LNSQEFRFGNRLNLIKEAIPLRGGGLPNKTLKGAGLDKLKVNCYSGHTYAERPESFLWQGIEYKRVLKKTTF